MKSTGVGFRGLRHRRLHDMIDVRPRFAQRKSTAIKGSSRGSEEARLSRQARPSKAPRQVPCSTDPAGTEDPTSVHGNEDMASNLTKKGMARLAASIMWVV